MDMSNCVQILDEAVCFSLFINTLRDGMNPSLPLTWVNSSAWGNRSRRKKNLNSKPDTRKQSEKKTVDSSVLFPGINAQKKLIVIYFRSHTSNNIFDRGETTLKNNGEIFLRASSLCRVWGLRIRSVYLMQIKIPPKRCKYDTKLHLMVMFLFWRIGKCEVLPHWYYFQIYFHLELQNFSFSSMTQVNIFQNYLS